MTPTLSPIARPRTFALLAAVSAMTLMGTSTAQAQDAPPVNTGKVAWTTGFDVVTEYWFRGIGQENEGLILQPWVDMTATLIQTDNYTLTGTVGLWNSVQDSTPGDAWYESDFYAGFTAKTGDIEIGTQYVVLYNPSGGDIFAEEVNVSFGYDDSNLWGQDGFALNPTALLAIETDGGSDAGNNKGTYLQLGIEPVFADVCGSDSVKVDMAIPVKLGLSLDDYYENGAGDDDTFGYLDIGAVFSTPLADLIPADYGNWTASAGVHVIFLGDTAQDISEAFGTGSDDYSIYGTFGLKMEY